MGPKEFQEKVGETARSIRYLVAEECIPAPEGPRNKPDYTQAHVDAVLRYRELRTEHRPSEIRALLKAETLVRKGGRITLLPGVTLSIDPSAFGTEPINPRTVGALASAAVRQFIANKTRENHHAA